jgi:hypothetical protein
MPGPSLPITVKKALALIASGAAIIACVGFLYMYRLWKEDIKTYLPVQAHVNSSQATSWLRRGRSGFYTKYKAIVDYQYTVDEKIYLSSTVSPDPEDAFFERYDQAKSFVAQYKPGQDCKAYYDPRNPQHSFLVAKLSSVFVVWFYLAVAVICFGLSLRYALRAPQRG